MKSKSLAPIPTTLALSAFLVAPGFAAESAPVTPAPEAPATQTADKAPEKTEEQKKKDAAKKKEGDKAEGDKLEDTTVSAKKEAEAPSYKAKSANFKNPTPLIDTPSQITVIPQQLLQDRNAISLQDALRTTPGITANTGEGGNSGGDNFNIRGFSARSDIYIDGIRDNSLYARDIFTTEQVEVTRGASGVYQGKGSTGGSINLVTKAPHAVSSADVAATLNSANSVRLVADGNFDISGNATAASVKDTGAAARVTVLGQDGGSLRTPDSDDTRFGVMPSVTVGLGKQTQLTLSYLYLDQQKDGDYGVPMMATADKVSYSPVDYQNWYGTKGLDRDNTTQNITTVTAVTQLDEGHTLRNITRYNTNDRDTVITRPVSTATSFNPGGTVNLQYNNRYAEDTSIDNTTDYVGEFKTGIVSHTLNIGAELLEETNTTRARTLTGAPTTKDTYNPTHYTATPYTLAFTGANTKAVGDTYSVYINEAFHATKWLDVIGGLRYDRFEFESRSYTATGTSTSVQSEDNLLSWRTGLVLKPAKNVTVYGTVSNSYTPSAQDLAASAANQSLDPEQTYLYEIGTRWEPILGKLTLGAAYFYTDKFNLRQNDPLTGVASLTGGANSQGIELTANGNITSQWNVFGGVSYMWTEVTKDTTTNPATSLKGKELTNVPDWSATLMTSYTVESWTFGGGMRYMGDRWVDGLNTTKVGDYIVFDGFLRKQLTSYASIQFNIDNIFDERYLETVRTNQTQWATPGAGRIYSVTARLSF